MNNEASAELFSQLLRISNGEVPTIPETNHDIILPEDLAIKIAELDDFIDSVYPNISNNFTNVQWLIERSILAPHNDTVDEVYFREFRVIPSPTNRSTVFDTKKIQSFIPPKFSTP